MRVDFAHNVQRNTWTCLRCLDSRGSLSSHHAASHENTNKHQHRVAEYHAAHRNAHRTDQISGIAGPSEYAGDPFLESLVARLSPSPPEQALQAHPPKAVNPPPRIEFDYAGNAWPDSLTESHTRQIRAAVKDALDYYFHPDAGSDGSSQDEGNQGDRVEAEPTDTTVDSCGLPTIFA